jgi:hypothetical protein
MQFISDYEPEWTGIEERTYHRIHMYGGTIDREGPIARRDTIIDIKTGAAERWHVLQGTAYQAARDTHVGELLDIAGLYLKDNGTYKYISHEADRCSWEAVLAVYEWKMRA